MFENLAYKIKTKPEVVETPAVPEPEQVRIETEEYKEWLVKYNDFISNFNNGNKTLSADMKKILEATIGPEPQQYH